MTTDPGAEEGRFEDLARAKVNLFLHVLGARADGLHELESLVVFPEIGDALRAEPGPIRSLSLEGPFAAALDDGEDNLVLRATEAFAEATGAPDGVALTLDKRLPVAAGIGGGSADAAAAMRLLARLWGRSPDAGKLARLAMSLGADVPVCLASAPAFMRGAGERLTPAPAFPGCGVVLVNPGIETPTGPVFAGLERRENPPADPAPARFVDFDGFVCWLSRQRNDLEASAARLAPPIGEVSAALRRTPGCRLARMSGSGATCFGLFETPARAAAAAREIRAAAPGWWAADARLKPWEP